MTVVIGDWPQQQAAATALRHAVFVTEQQVPIELELDEFDASSEHAVAWLGDQAVGTGRLLPDGHIGRMAVDRACRGKGVGTALLEALLAQAGRRGMSAVRLHAQTHAQGFYARCGFVQEGEPFEEAGIPHIAMRKSLPG